MFIHETHLPNQLAPDHYTSEEHCQRELESLFRPGWHCVGAMTDLPNNGDYFTLKLFGRPLIVWRKEDEVHAFLNVCTHRFSLISRKPCGHFDGHLKCQYHGWEYDETGNTCRIPDARSFRPMEKGKLGLTAYRTERVGQLIFVTQEENAPSLKEYLGEYLYELCERWFTDEHRHTVNLDIDHDCNWKVVVENVLEGYHINCVHPTTFEKYPDPECCTHEIHGFWDRYTDDYTNRGTYTGREKFVSRLAGVEPDFMWKHLARYPNVVFGQMGLFTWVQTVVPVTPTTCHAIWRIFHYPGKPGRTRTKLAHVMLKSWGSRFMAKVVGEDADIYPSIQRGIGADERPGEGLISIREERIFAFQDFILSAIENGRQNVPKNGRTRLQPVSNPA